MYATTICVSVSVLLLWWYIHGKCALCMCVEDVGHGFGIPNGLFMNMLC